MDLVSTFGAYTATADNTTVFLFHNGELLVHQYKNVITIPVLSKLNTFTCDITTLHYIGTLNEKPCYVGTLLSKSIAPGFGWYKPRELYGRVDDECFKQLLRCFHLWTWFENNKFCSRCGGVMAAAADELAVTCTKCGYLVYPRISPAVIVAVTKDDHILLARANRFPPGRYSVLAGFVEPGETLEECIKREIREEVGLEVTDINYFGSQPWPFPDSLMIAFTARYAGGEITIDNKEIVAAGWFKADNLPDLPGTDSIARKLINWFISQHSAKT